jgi:hypothetical protein
VGGNVQPEPLKQYNALSAQLSKAFDLTPGLPESEDNEAELFANAYNLARAAITLKKAGLQRDVSKVTDLLPLQEQSYLVTPLPNQTIYQRQQTLVALKQLSRGGTTSNIISALTAAIGSAFVKLRVLSLSSDECAADQPTTNFQPLGLVGKWLQLVAPVGIIDASTWASYGPLDPTVPLENPLAVGDVITVQAENNQIREVTTVTGLQTTASGVPQFQATFSYGHDQGATITTSSMPLWTSSRACLLVEVTQAASVDATIRAQVDAIMQKICRGTCTWATVAAIDGSIGPFTVNTTPLGTATAGALSA